jgi:hypothetical protein
MFIRVKALIKGPITYGTGLAGSNGVPAIGWSGKWHIGSTNFTIKCTNARPSAPGYLFLGLAPLNLPTYGGTLLVGPPGLTVINLFSNASGQVNIPA